MIYATSAAIIICLIVVFIGGFTVGISKDMPTTRAGLGAFLLGIVTTMLLALNAKPIKRIDIKDNNVDLSRFYIVRQYSDKTIAISREDYDAYVKDKMVILLWH